MSGRLASAIVIATAAMLAGCGSGSSTKTAITRSQSTGSGHVVTARSGAFSTIVPQGYTYAPTAAQYVVTGSEAGEGVPTIAVVRQPSSEGDVATVARQTLRALRRPPTPAQQASALRSLSVAGEPARAVDYVVAAPRQVEHLIIVLVGHGEWVYSIRAASSPAQYQGLTTALDEVTRNWHWT